MTRYRTGLALVGAAAAITMLGAPALAKMNVETVVDALNAPRGITLDADGSILVAEAGAGGDQCMGEGESAVCMGTTGTITRIVDGAATPVATGLLSAALSGGAEIVGPSDVAAAADGTLYVTMNLGADPADRAGMPPEAAGVAGWLVSVAPDGTVTPFADVAAFEASDNPEPTLVDSNPYSVAVTDAGFVVADAGGNDLLAVDPSGVVSLVAAFPPFEALFPAEMLAAMGPPPEGEGGAAAEAAESGAPAEPAGESMAPAAESMAPADPAAESMAPADPAAESMAPASGAPAGEMVPLPIEWVPTSVVVGPDGAYYVGQLTGGPFPVGKASVLRVDPATGDATTYATGFTNIIDIAFGPDGTLYVAEIVHDGLMGVFTAGAAPIGALLSVPPGGGEPTILINDETFMAPGGITVDAEGTIYASLNTLAPGAGSVVRITPES